MLISHTELEEVIPGEENSYLQVFLTDKAKH